MKCCVRCFKDQFIKETIKKLGTRGNCDFCSAKGVSVYDISDSNEISDMIIDLVQTYEVSSIEQAKPLKNAIHDDWDIFSGGVEAIQALLLALCSNQIDKNDKIFTENVVIPNAYNNDFLTKFGVIKGLSWHQFSESIKYQNRFHNSLFNHEAFKAFLSVATKIRIKGYTLYRARIANNIEGFKTDEMFAPPIKLSKAGRANPQGISVLYLSSDYDTVLKEVRANKYDFVSIGEFKAKQDIRIADLSFIPKMSPFHFQDVGEIDQFFVNRSVFQEMALEIAKPLRRNDSELEYLSTQYVAEFAKSLNFDGVAFQSTLHNKGYNFAIFDQNLFECTSVETIEVNEIEYRIKRK